MITSSPHQIAMTAAALLGCFVLAGSAQAQEECDPAACTITLTVNNCQAQGGITVEPDIVLVRSARHMHWVIEPQGYEFAANGIEFRQPHPQFERLDSPRPHEFHIQNHKTQAGDFYYYVNITDSNGNACKRVDPTVRNN